MPYIHGPGTHTAGEALEPYRRVLLNSSNVLMYADANERCIGITDGRVASGDPCAVKYLTQEGTVEVECNEAVEVGDLLYGGDDGKVSDTSTSAIPFGTAVSTTTATGQIVTVLVQQGAPV